jgi:L-iditol 2-dehydrogenase
LDFAHALPDGVSDEAGAFVEPLSVGIQALVRCGFEAGQVAAVLGAGTIGLVILLAAKAFGATRVFVFDRLETRLDMAVRLGADAAVNIDSEPVESAIEELTNGRRADAVFDASGSSTGFASAALIAARGGKVIFVGWPETARVAVPANEIIERELNIYGVHRYANTFPKAISLIAGNKIDVEPLVSHRFPFSEVCEAFAFASKNRRETLKVMVHSSQ